MSDKEPKERVSMTLPKSLVTALDAAVDDAPDYLGLTRSELARHAVEQGLDDWDEQVESLIPDELLAKYRVKRHDERVQQEYYIIDKREGWRGRVKSRLNKRLAGEEPYHPDGVEILSRGYRDELRYLHRLAPESSRTLSEDREWLESKINGYREAYAAKQAVPNGDPYSGIEDKIETGRDLLSLQDRAADLVADIEDRADGAAYDPDSIIRSLAAEYAVSERSIEVVLDVLLPDDVDPRQALKSLEDSGIESILPPEAVESTERPEIEGETVIDDSPDMVEGDMADRTLSVRLDDLPTERDEVDGETVEQIVREQVRGDGGDR
jgi:hypothetical protein